MPLLKDSGLLLRRGQACQLESWASLLQDPPPSPPPKQNTSQTGGTSVAHSQAHASTQRLQAVGGLLPWVNERQLERHAPRRGEATLTPTHIPH